jgi:hypothetical protein
MTVMIGIDPHKPSHAPVGLEAGEEFRGEPRVRSVSNQFKPLIEWAAPLTDPTCRSRDCTLRTRQSGLALRERERPR